MIIKVKLLQLVTASIEQITQGLYYSSVIATREVRFGVHTDTVVNSKVVFHNVKGTSIGQFTRLLRSLELRAVSHCTVLLLWDQKLFFRKRDCFEGSIIHLPTI